MNSQIHQIRKIAQRIQQGKQTFESLYKYLDTLEKVTHQQAEQQSSSDQQQNGQLSEYVNPIRKMLSDYRHGINRIKRQNIQIQSVFSKEAKENNPNKINRKTELKDYQCASVEQLDSQINQLTTKIQKCYLK